LLLYQGKRKIRPEHIEKLSKGLKISETESQFLRALVHLENAKTEKEQELYLQQMKTLYPAPEFSILEVEKFRMISDWVHMAILEMTKLADFQSDVLWITERLAFRLPVQTVEVAVQRLQRLGLLKTEKGRWIKTQERLTTPKDFASESIREHHRQVLTNGTKALTEQSIDERVFNSCAMTVKSSKLPEAKELIRKFRSEMAQLMECNEGDETYQLTVGFFKLTQKKPEAL
jgi:uncharacterized protein (TIGR02147 family)